MRKRLAGEIAKGVDGVEAVKNKISIDGTGPSYPEANEFSLRIEDLSTAAAIRSKLYWNRHINPEAVRVAVNKGVATLSGSLATEQQKELVPINGKKYTRSKTGCE